MNGEMAGAVVALMLGFIAGILSGLFGIGGGLVIVPALVMLLQMPLRTAMGTSLFALLWPVGLLGVVEYWKAGDLSVGRGTLIAVGLFFGAYLGARIALSISPTSLRRFYAVFLLIVGVYFLVTTHPEPERKTVVAPPSASSGDGAEPAQVH